MLHFQYPYLCWKTCMSRPPLGKLWDPNRSFTDCDSWAAPAPVKEKLLYWGLCICNCSTIKKNHTVTWKSLITMPLMTNCIKLTLLEVCLRTVGHFQFVWTMLHCRNDRTATATRKHCICLHFSRRWSSISCSFNITKVLWNALCSTRAFRWWSASSRVAWRWIFIFSTRRWTCCLRIVRRRKWF